MEIGLIGLGRMGAGMARRWIRGGHTVVVHNRSTDPIKELEQDGAIGAYGVEELVSKLSTPRAIWIMLPAGDITENMIDTLIPLLAPGDTIVDGGNTNYRDDQGRAKRLKEHQLHYVDQGTSGGVWGLEVGFCLMVGGDTDVVKRLEPAFVTLAPEDGYAHVGPVGAGHFVKMVHNGVEYGMMQAYAEGFDIMNAATDYDLDMHQIAAVWNHGSVVRSWLLELAEASFKEDPDLEKLKGYVEDSGEGRWTIQSAIDFDVPAPVITLSLFERFHSRREDTYAAKVLAALRNQFGGHAVKKAE
ncbi:MAG: decarboxylating 6-phosphogluconate dehydrogenase [Chloroflexi bacterium AL-W]|nr:decarboxylating 6-phosphogluconate dehydrogenase [Chloroflexi bacterium AL-N1]NOK71179.1 decarboxylating 6-phosphogluconate dehydrogenase [Chloroflexi bacterium AL-N10]NOK78645.1 decarboxylating 6-phosphogluconate dehydrogenase [Chloroflexi bacterium AL-N5]NOK85941.1 decarboxylating 6-phosphogluconate dehydrogenase [Chloroflexi bacterium AL-W]NOK92916.1 decarboxylating 6-phosphogluconate dehydrogenase [Chloroflexi bacterium AL-N15]